MGEALQTLALPLDEHPVRHHKLLLARPERFYLVVIQLGFFAILALNNDDTIRELL
ncbi:MAG: hypothetical protein ACRYFX_14820 [Janthinobacterium lividum]